MSYITFAHDGEAKAYGLEVLLRKNLGKLTGWIAYTLSKSERTFDAIENDRVKIQLQFKALIPPEITD